MDAVKDELGFEAFSRLADRKAFRPEGKRPQHVERPERWKRGALRKKEGGSGGDGGESGRGRTTVIRRIWEESIHVTDIARLGACDSIFRLFRL
jgi:hypothetical protein